MPPASRTQVLQAVGTAVPEHEVHRAFIKWATEQIPEGRNRKLFNRMAGRSGIDRRWSVLPVTPGGGSPVDTGGFYDSEPLPGTAARMQAYARYAPSLAIAAITDLKRKVDLHDITHLVFASCTGFMAPGIDQLVARELKLADNVERVLIGFMGCYAGITALRTAHHIARSEPSARVLVVAIELSTLHLSPTDKLEELLAMLQFSDGAAAALVTSRNGSDEALPAGAFTLGRSTSLTLADADDLIQWHIGDRGFNMRLSGEVPSRLQATLADAAFRSRLFPSDQPYTLHAVHPGGRSILDAVQRGLDLPTEALSVSRAVLQRNGNMSSATVLFVLAEMMQRKLQGRGIALAFGPGVAVEGIEFMSE